LNEGEIKEAVRKHYGELAVLNEPCCGGITQSSCCTTSLGDHGIPSEALSAVASCGSPLTHTQVQGGEIGLDATPEMIFRARETAKKHGYKNVEFRLGEIEHMPIQSSSVDLVISNCVLNLVPDKNLAFKEIYRVLKPGGRISVSDMVATQESQRKITPEEWAACIAGAVTLKEYKRILEETGFTEIQGSDESHPINQEAKTRQLSVKSVTWEARKPN
jgi:arsenite methyltransferase